MEVGHHEITLMKVRVHGNRRKNMPEMPPRVKVTRKPKAQSV